MYALSRYEPLVGRLDGLFNELLRPGFTPANGADSQPLPLRVDVKETADAYILTAELPGVNKEDISVEIERNEVTISAATDRAAPAEGERWLRTERTFGKAGRRFALPQELDEARVAARLELGVLELTLPKKAAPVGRKIAIN
jgi:HSP20 family protein